MAKQSVNAPIVNQLHQDEEMEDISTDDLTSLASGKSFEFLNDEEDLYTESDIKEPYAKR
ncbi:hypothetical protein GCM10027049_26870 [Mucilaginibacter puniceus]